MLIPHSPTPIIRPTLPPPSQPPLILPTCESCDGKFDTNCKQYTNGLGATGVAATGITSASDLCPATSSTEPGCTQCAAGYYLVGGGLGQGSCTVAAPLKLFGTQAVQCTASSSAFCLFIQLGLGATCTPHDSQSLLK